MLLIKKDAISRLFLRPGIGDAVMPQNENVSQKIMKTTYLYLLFLLAGNPAFAKALPSSCSESLATDEYDEIAELHYVHDGDTLRLRDGRKIRLIGINTPELARDTKPAEAYSREARETLQSLFEKDNFIGLRFGKDKKDHYGRFLAHVFSADRQNAQATLLKYGYAFAINIPPNTHLATCYLALEHEARCNKRGLWQDTNIINAKDLDLTHLGFHLIQGNVENITIDKKGIWINLDNKLTVGIRSANRHLFDITTINTMLNQTIMVRGWLNKSDRSTPFYIRIRHPLSIQLSSNYHCD